MKHNLNTYVEKNDFDKEHIDALAKEIFLYVNSWHLTNRQETRDVVINKISEKINNIVDSVIVYFYGE